MAKKSPKHLKVVKIFIGSPSDLIPERGLFRKAIEKVNEIKGEDKGVLLKAVGWEDTMPGKGRPQEMINADLEECDLIIMLLWERWGSKTGQYTSGFEEEYEVARAAGKKIFFYFKSIPEKMLADPGKQLKQVLKFRKKIEMEKGYLYRHYENKKKWQNRFELDMCNWLDKLPPEEMDISALQEKARKFDELSDTLSDLDADKQQLAGSYIDLAWKHANSGKLTKAEEEFVKALEISRSPEAITAYGQFLFRIGLLDKAGQIFREFLEIGEAARDQTIIAQANIRLGRIYQTRGELEKAEGMYRQSLALSEGLGRKKGMADSYGNLGLIFQIRGEINKAEEMYRQSLALEEELGHKAGMADAYGSLGIIYQNRDELEKAEEMLRLSLALSEELGRKEGMAIAYGNLGNIYMIRGELEKAEEMLRLTLALHKEMGRKAGMATAYYNLGIIYQVRGETGEAGNLFLKARDLYAEVGMQIELEQVEKMLENLRDQDA